MSIDTIVLAVGTADEKRADRLTEETIDVAVPTGADVVLAHVFADDEFADVRDKLDVDADSEEGAPDEVAKRHTTTRTVSKALTGADVDHEIRGAVGERGAEIVEIAERTDADRVLVGGRSRSPAGKAVFGSVAQEVMLSAPCPVTFVREGTK